MLYIYKLIENEPKIKLVISIFFFFFDLLLFYKYWIYNFLKVKHLFHWPLVEKVKNYNTTSFLKSLRPCFVLYSWKMPCNVCSFWLDPACRYILNSAGWDLEHAVCLLNNSWGHIANTLGQRALDSPSIQFCFMWCTWSTASIIDETEELALTAE